MKKIIHIDMDCFYAAVEMRENPSYKNMPIVVGGDANKRGVVAAANYIARDYGIHSAMPVSQALKLCQYLQILPVRMQLYRDVSSQIHQIFKRYTDKIEPLSLDEAYLDVSECHFFQGSATLIAQDIRNKISDELQLTASAGIAPLKFLAKIASDINKPNGQYVISPNDVSPFINKLPLNKIPGVGKVTEQKLTALGLITCADILNYDLKKLLQQFGKFGYILYQRCQGIDDREVENSRQRKSIGVEKTLHKDIFEWSDCLLLLNDLYNQLETRLSKTKADLSIARQGVKYKFEDFQSTTQEQASQKLNKELLFEQAYQVWLERRNDRGVRLIGFHVILQNPLLAKQLSLTLV